MNALSNKVAVEGYMRVISTEDNKSLLHISQMTKNGAVEYKIICDNNMLSSIGVTERTKILVDGRMIGGVIHARHILRLN